MRQKREERKEKRGESMLDAIKRFFEDNLTHDEENHLTDYQKHLACAALMVEVAAIDEHFDASEFEVLKQHLQQQFSIHDRDLNELAELARIESKESLSLYQFTRLVNDYCSPVEKFELLQGMWKVARADGHVDKYEEYMIRKISELIYVSHSDFIRTKQTSL